MFAGLIAKLGLNLVAGKAVANAKRDWAAIPPKVKLAIFAIAAAVALFFVHQHYAHNALKAADQAGYDRARREDDAALKQARERARTAETNLARIAQEERTKNDQANRDTSTRAGAVLMRGPGAARCGQFGNSQPAGAAGRHDQAAGAGIPPVAGMPDDQRTDLIALPFAGAVAAGKQCDLDRNEVKSWHEWWPRFVAEWAKLKAPSPPAK